MTINIPFISYPRQTKRAAANSDNSCRSNCYKTSNKADMPQKQEFYQKMIIHTLYQK